MQKLKELQAADFLSEVAYAQLAKFIPQGAFELNAALEIARNRAKEVGVNKSTFDSLWEAYKQSMPQDVAIYAHNDLTLETGHYTITTNVIGPTGIVCAHPIIPVERQLDLVTGEYSYTIAFARGPVWGKITLPAKVLASSKKIVEPLAAVGVSVTDATAADLVSYLNDMIDRNFETIPTVRTSSRMGWNGEDFLPYSDDIIFSGEESAQNLFRSIKSAGSFLEWQKAINTVRHGSGTFHGLNVDNALIRIMLAASFAAPLVSKFAKYNPIVHLYGGSSNGKSLAQKVCATVWGSDDYLQTWNATRVGHETKLDMLRNLPYIVEDSQNASPEIAKNISRFAYVMESGYGKSRGKKDGGLRRQMEWQTTIISTGEKPMVEAESDGGSIARVVSLNSLGKALFADPTAISDIIDENYGLAGPIFVKYLSEPVLEKAAARHKELWKEISQHKANKQANIAASLIVADELACKYIYQDDYCLTVADLMPYLASDQDIDQNGAHLELFRSWIAQNRSHFFENPDDVTTEVYGINHDSEVYVYNTAFTKFCNEYGVNKKVFADWLKIQGHLDGNPTKVVRIGGQTIRVYAFKKDRWA